MTNRRTHDIFATAAAIVAAVYFVDRDNKAQERLRREAERRRAVLDALRRATRNDGSVIKPASSRTPILAPLAAERPPVRPMAGVGVRSCPVGLNRDSVTRDRHENATRPRQTPEQRRIDRELDARIERWAQGPRHDACRRPGSGSARTIHQMLFTARAI
jgi:hypothetical protein